jgi:putative transposase
MAKVELEKLFEKASGVGRWRTLRRMKRSNPTDLTNAEWKVLEPYVPAPNKLRRPRIHASRRILDAVFYVLKSGCPWRLLPREFPPWETVYCWFRKWRMNGTFERAISR